MVDERVNLPREILQTPEGRLLSAIFGLDTPVHPYLICTHCYTEYWDERPTSCPVCLHYGGAIENPRRQRSKAILMELIYRDNMDELSEPVVLKALKEKCPKDKVYTYDKIRQNKAKLEAAYHATVRRDRERLHDDPVGNFARIVKAERHLHEQEPRRLLILLCALYDEAPEFL